MLDNKLEAEKLLRSSGLDWTIVRPGGLSNEAAQNLGNLYVSREDTLFGGGPAPAITPQPATPARPPNHAMCFSVRTSSQAGRQAANFARSQHLPASDRLRMRPVLQGRTVTWGGPSRATRCNQFTACTRFAVLYALDAQSSVLVTVHQLHTVREPRLSCARQPRHVVHADTCGSCGHLCTCGSW